MLDKIENSKAYKEFIAEHPQAYLSHFFSAIDSNYALKGDWEIGYYEPDADKVTVFVLNDEVTKKAEDEVFKKEQDEVEKLEVAGTLSFEEAVKVLKEKFNLVFPDENVGDGFIILQKMNGKRLWNLTFISKALQFLNLKIDAVSGTEVSHERIDLLSK